MLWDLIGLLSSSCLLGVGFRVLGEDNYEIDVAADENGMNYYFHPTPTPNTLL